MKIGITDSTLCMKAIEETAYYWKYAAYERNWRNWVSLTAHYVWQQPKKLSITDSTLCMTATAETGYYRQQAVYESNWWNWVLQQAQCLSEYA
jgi:hypothetical protein